MRAANNDIIVAERSFHELSNRNPQSITLQTMNRGMHGDLETARTKPADARAKPIKVVTVKSHKTTKTRLTKIRKTGSTRPAGRS